MGRQVGTASQEVPEPKGIPVPLHSKEKEVFQGTQDLQVSLGRGVRWALQDSGPRVPQERRGSRVCLVVRALPELQVLKETPAKQCQNRALLGQEGRQEIPGFQGVQVDQDSQDSQASQVWEDRRVTQAPRV